MRRILNQVWHKLVGKQTVSASGLFLGDHFDKAFRFADWVGDTLGNGSVDVCLVHDSLALEAAKSVLIQTGCSMIYDAVEYPDYTGRSGPVAKRLIGMERALSLIHIHEVDIWRRMDVLLVGTKGVADWYAGQDGLPSARIVRNCLDYQEVTENPQIREDCGLLNGDKLIIYPNSVHPNCGLSELIAALKEMPDMIHLAVVGQLQPIQRRWLEKYIKSLKLKSRVHILPLRHPHDLLSYRSGADLSVIPLNPIVPNHHAALPNRVFESIMSRLPLVISDLPHVREIVEDFNCGAIFSSLAPDVIALSVMNVLENLSAYRTNIDLAARALCWENERTVFLDAIELALKARKELNILCLANKPLTTNRRMFRHTRTLAEEGHKVRVLSLYDPIPEFQDARICYQAMKDKDPLLNMFNLS